MEDGRQRGGDDARPPKLLVEEQFSSEFPRIVHQISSAEIFIFACLLLIHGKRVRLFADSWLQAFVVLTSGINSAYMLGYSGTIMVKLGWGAGVVGLLVGNILSLYANILVAKLHELGGRRHIRYRDLAGYLYGKKGYIIISALQYVMLFMINLGYIILGGSALKAVYVLFRDDNNIKLPYFIAIAGFLCFMFAISVPHSLALRVWLGVSTILALIYVTIVIVYSIKDGANAPATDYSISGTLERKIFTIIGAVANLFFPFNTGMIPEIQATIRNPVVSNMMKALYAQFTVGVLPLFAVAFAGYWAYGSSTSAYLLNSISGPIWLKTLANISAFLQAAIAFHIFASPTYEYLDTKYGIQGGALAIRNLSFRIGVRGSYLIISTMVSALLPFLGDSMSLSGAICTIPVTFIIPNHMYLMAKERYLTPLQKLWHWLNICCFGCLSITAAVAALRLIAADSKTHHVFADLP